MGRSSKDVLTKKDLSKIDIGKDRKGRYLVHSILDEFKSKLMIQFREDVVTEVLTELGMEPEDQEHPLWFVSKHAKGKRLKKQNKESKTCKEGKEEEE